MELIEGETLAQRLAAHGPMDLTTVALFVGQVAAALDYAHNNGIVHRDIKPANLIIDPGERIRLADFGIAKPLDDAATITSPGEVVGTISYVAPEIIGGENASAASDIYSLAAVTYEMLTGEKPFSRDTAAGLLEAIRTADGPILVGKVPPEAIPALTRALAKDPSERPVSAAAFVAGLSEPSTLVLPVGVSAPAAPPFVPPESRVSPDESTVLKLPDPNQGERRDSDLSERRPLRRSLAVAGGLVLVGVIAILSIAADRSGTKYTGVLARSATTGSTTTAATTTSSVVATTEPSPTSLAAEIGTLLASLGPPDYKPKDVREVDERIEKAVEQWRAGDMEKSAESLEKAFDSIERFPESEARDDLVGLMTALAEEMGFELRVRRRMIAGDA